MTAPGVTAIGQIAITVTDLEGAVTFYRDQVGLPFLFFAPPGMAFLQCGEVRLLLGTADAGHPVAPASILYFRTADIAATHHAMAARGVTFRNAPHLVHKTADHELWLAEFAAPEGSTHALMEERRTA